MRSKCWRGARAAAVLALGLSSAAAVWAHHDFAAEYDEKKPVTLKGTVTKFEWNNPHVFFYVDVAEAGGAVTNWAVEWASPSDLRKAGWTDDSLKVGETVTVEGSLARDGSKQAMGKSVAIAGGKKLAEAPEAARVAKSSGSKPAPRWPDGHPRLGPAPGEKGYWASPTAASMVETTAGNIRMNSEGVLANLADAAKVAPFQPWAKGLYEYRQRNLLKDDPMVSCLPPGGPRQFQVAHGVQFLEQPDRKRIFVLSGGGNRNWRLIYLDGRANPQSEDVSPTYFGYSSGKWEGDTLVIDTVDFNERFWFSNGGLPHTESLHLTERISRPDLNTLKYEVTVNDPGAYTRPWTATWNLEWQAGQDIEEYFCQDNPRDAEHMVGK